jgi:cell division protease FtsH
MLTVIDGKRAHVTIPIDSNLVDIILVMNGVDISVFEADFSKSYINVLGNFFFPLLAFGGLFFLFKRIHVVFSK